MLKVLLGVAVDEKQIGLLVDLDGTDLLLAARIGRAVEGADFDGLHGRKAGFYQRLNMAAVSITGNATFLLTRELMRLFISVLP